MVDILFYSYSPTISCWRTRKILPQLSWQTLVLLWNYQKRVTSQVVRLYVVQCICLFLKCSQEGLPLQFCILKNPKFRISPWNCLPLHMCNKALLLSCTVDHAEAVWWADWKTASSAIVSDIQVQKPNYFKHFLCCQPLKIIWATAHDCEDDLLCSHSICGLIWIQEGCSLFLPANSSQKQYKIIARGL